ncbi:MAG: bleomycin resistance protein [Betaproteobacteria bacterium]
MPSRLVAAMPKLASLDIGRSLTFFERLGFRTVHASPQYGVVSRDGVSLHFWLCSDPRTPRETGCRISVEGIDELFGAFSKLGVVHPDGGLESKPWGAREFSILDIDGNLVTFSEASAINRGTASPVAGTPA